MVVCATLSLRGGNASEGRGNPLYAMGAYGQYGLLTGSQWIATSFALAMTRPKGIRVCGSVTTRSLSLRGGHASDRRGNLSCLGEGSDDFKIDHIMYWYV
jgi:hypothetical protein